MRQSALAVAILSAALLPCPAAALLLSATVSEEYRYPDLATPYPPVTYTPQSYTVGAGQESTILLEGVTTFNIDFTDTTLTIPFDTTLTNPTLAQDAFNGLVFTSTAFSQAAGVSVNGNTNLAGFDNSRVSLVGNELRLNFAGLSYDTNSVVGLTFSTRGGGVPEPATWVMMIAGFGGVGLVMRRRKREVARQTLTRA